MIPVPPSGLSEATAEHAAATSRKSPSLINGNFIESKTGYTNPNGDAVIREPISTAEVRKQQLIVPSERASACFA